MGRVAWVGLRLLVCVSLRVSAASQAEPDSEGCCCEAATQIPAFIIFGCGFKLLSLESGLGLWSLE